MGASRTPTVAPRSGGTCGSLRYLHDPGAFPAIYAGFAQGISRTVCGDQTLKPSARNCPRPSSVILLGPPGGSPRRRRSGVNRHSSSCPVGTGDPPVALLIGVPSGDLSGRCGVLVVACAAAGSVMALLPPRIGIMRRHRRPPCGPRAVGSANRRPARQAPPGGPPGCVPARSLSPGIFRASALACCGRPPSFPPGQPWRPEDPDSTIHVRKAVTMIAEDDPCRLVTCGSVVVAAGGCLRRPRVRSQAARPARLCGHGRHGGFCAD
jgi:hypothetical protein